MQPEDMSRETLIWAVGRLRSDSVARCERHENVLASLDTENERRAGEVRRLRAERADVDDEVALMAAEIVRLRAEVETLKREVKWMGENL